MKPVNNAFLAKSCDGVIMEREPVPALDYLSSEFIEIVKYLIEHHNHRKDYRCKQSEWQGTVVFSTYQAAFIWMEECLGQISDGKYENTFSHEEWTFFHNLRVEVDIRRVPQYRVRSAWFKARRVSFKDLLWLFDKECRDTLAPDYTEVDPLGVRSIFSNCPTEALKKYMDEISDAFRWIPDLDGTAVPTQASSL